MSIYKESFAAIVQLKVETITDKYVNMDENLINLFNKIVNQPDNTVFNSIMESQQFKELYSHIVTPSEGTESKMTIEYLKDVSSLLSMVWAVRSGNFDGHLQSERDIIKQCFAFDHVRYSRYLSYQHVLLKNMENENHPAIQDLISRGYGRSMSGDLFSAIHGDLVTEIFNGATKRQGGPHRGGFTNDVHVLNTWIKTTHIHAKIRTELKNKIHLKTSSVPKESTPSGKKYFPQSCSIVKSKARGV